MTSPFRIDPSAAIRSSLDKLDPYAAIRLALKNIKEADLSKLLAESLSKIDFTLGLADLERYEGTAYHYTSGRALEGILSSRTFHAAEATSMNDLSEIILGWQRIESWLARQGNDAAVRLMRGSVPDHRGAAGVFVLSATLVKDDAHQWRSYGDDACGFAIGIDCSVELFPTAPMPSHDEPIEFDTSSVEQWRRVMYREDETHAALDSLLSSIRDKGLAAQATNGDEPELARSLVRSRVASLLTSIAHLVKHPGFAGEEEVRLVAANLQHDQAQYRGPSQAFSAYTKLASAGSGTTRRPGSAPNPPHHQLPISAVRLGPKLASMSDPEHQALMIRRTQMYLAQHDLGSAHVEASEVPLR